MMDIQYAKQILKTDLQDKARDGGCHCPVCGQYAKVYRRQIAATTVRQLAKVYHEHGVGVYFHVRDTMLRGMSGAADFPKLEYWNLIRRMPHNEGDDGKKSSGMWKITPSGKAFLQDHLAVPQYALVYNGNVLAMEGNMVNVRQCLGQKFDYNELMGRLV